MAKEPLYPSTKGKRTIMDQAIDINKLPSYAYFMESYPPFPFTIIWERHKDGTVSFVSQRLTKQDLAQLLSRR